MYVHSNKILIMEFPAGFKTSSYKMQWTKNCSNVITITNKIWQLDILYKAIETLVFAGLDQSTIAEYK